MMMNLVSLLALLFSSSLAFVGPSQIGQKCRVLSLRSTESEDEITKESKTPRVKAGQYDVSKLVNRQEGAGFNQFDPLLTTTRFVSRRFGILGGLAIFVGLAAIEGKEIFGAFTQQAPQAGSDDIISLPSGLKYQDILVSKQGNSPIPGYVIGLQAVVKVGSDSDSKVIYDTKDDKPIAFKYGARPFQNVLCEGVEQGIKGMKPGGKRRIFVPASLAPPGVDLPPGVPLVYDVELTEVLSGYF
uniref:peptidylprolyl isomerase n=1 Tax=Aureoumbra lagunensis TaxID=44058 RepID=A0A7S3K5U3_9STRA|mmetsp:Transcript_8242/g.10491  ORF Transcript_8242/g.10491 Transcript_8242/m.10491 type:complete len:243 (+) Transcript_8242:55-783(+)